MTTTTAPTLTFDTLSNEMVEHMMQMRFGAQLAVRDANGNLREMTQAEIDFGHALRGEAERRGLR